MQKIRMVKIARTLAALDLIGLLLLRGM